MALVHAPVREPRRGGGRGPRQGAGRRPAPDADRGQGQARGIGGGPQLARGLGLDAEAGRSRPGRGRRPDPVRRRDRRRRGLGGRIGDHRRVCPVIRESGGDRSAVTGGTRVLSDQILVRITAAPGVHLHRPHDRPGRRCRAAEDAQRDRAQHPARRHDADLRSGGGQHPELCRLRRRLDPGHRPGGPVRHPDPHHDRCFALGHRHRRHGPTGPLQRAGHVRPSGRGRRRRRHPAARQDRHDHAGQPPGHRADRHARRVRPGSGRCRPAVQLPRRDARGPLDRRAGQGEVWSAGARDGAACTPASSRSPPRRG